MSYIENITMEGGLCKEQSHRPCPIWCVTQFDSHQTKMKMKRKLPDRPIYRTSRCTWPPWIIGIIQQPLPCLSLRIMSESKRTGNIAKPAPHYPQWLGCLWMTSPIMSACSEQISLSDSSWWQVGCPRPLQDLPFDGGDSRQITAS